MKFVHSFYKVLLSWTYVYFIVVLGSGNLWAGSVFFEQFIHTQFVDV